MQILLVDDEQNSRESVAEFLTEMGHEVIEADNAGTAVRILKESSFPLVITDIQMPGMSGIELLEWIQKSNLSNCSVIVYTGHGDVNSAVSALRLGAFDYLQKPIQVSELAHLVSKVEEKSTVSESKVNQRQNQTVKRSGSSSQTYKSSQVFSRPSLEHIQDQIRIYSQDPDVPVIIEGETGTGKELVAKQIHQRTHAPKEKPFVDINCAALSNELFESELFGYEKGAFTGGKPGGEVGKMALSADGTLFLDEIGDMPLPLQPKLLRVLQDRSYYRVGGLQKEPFNARVICATNRNLSQMVESDSFRRDLFYRLNVAHIYLPPLRETPDDILLLAQEFLLRESRKRNKSFQGISQEAGELLEAYQWPGNVRELENTIERSVLVNDSSLLKIEHLHFLNSRHLVQKPSVPHEEHPTSVAGKLIPGSLLLPDKAFNLDDLVLEIVDKALKKFDQNKARTARYLGISRTSLYSRLKHLKKNEEQK